MHLAPSRAREGVGKQPELQRMWMGKGSGSSGQHVAQDSSRRECGGASGKHGNEAVGMPCGPDGAMEAHQPEEMAEVHGRPRQRRPRGAAAAACSPEPGGSAGHVEGAAVGGLDLEAVDVEEQRRIMRDIWLMSKQQGGGGSGGGKPPSPKAGRESGSALGKRGSRGSRDGGGPGKQLRISALFKAPRT